MIPSSESSAEIKKPTPWWLRLLKIIALLLLCFFGWFSWQFLKYYQSLTVGFMPREMAQAKHAPRDVVGNLGGMAVTIPRHFAEFVEYNGDPGFGEKRKGPVPVRTHESKLSSFGFDVRYPDMEGLSSPELRKDKASYYSYKTPWMRVGIRTGQIYPRDGFLDRRTDATIGGRIKSKYENYEKLPQKQHGLTVYAPAGINPDTAEPYRYHEQAHDVYINRDVNGAVTTFIECQNFSRGSLSCVQTFNLEPKAKSVVVVTYNRDNLREWKNIQESVRKLVFSFELRASDPDHDSGATPKP